MVYDTSNEQGNAIEVDFFPVNLDNLLLCLLLFNVLRQHPAYVTTHSLTGLQSWRLSLPSSNREKNWVIRNIRSRRKACKLWVMVTKSRPVPGPNCHHEWYAILRALPRTRTRTRSDQSIAFPTASSFRTSLNKMRGKRLSFSCARVTISSWP